ncbi:maleylpyruvate isomerase family mycothiol-dependent enzyme [Corynebacterium endometrii]|uniref:Mycothiol-dependent maleylpyruvate isomerase n=1 Tax=Corynebacterium endometrii TaxID=2488819 RepID=A0A4P7QEQ3_9CORY|nr:maleylpyruvate isomerase family mycothiol-dependent enzyme [Corynebacterium endometrii]QCB27979.1 mycothiol-dependent maleylpyruvate isomerase [Corynebacterium endometrii]
MVNFHNLPISERLTLTRRGTAFYSGQLALIGNHEFGDPTLLEDWDVAHLAAHVAYNANALCNLMHWASTGEETPMYSSPEARNREIEFGSTLIPDAIRNLHDHTLVRLDVAWRDADDAAWSSEVRTAQGRTVQASETLWMRTREVWLHAIDLNKTGNFSDVPRVILETLVPEIVQKWRSNGDGAGLVLIDSDSGNSYEASETASIEIHGTLAGLARWASGRGDAGVESPQGKVPSPPRWL